MFLGYKLLREHPSAVRMLAGGRMPADLDAVVAVLSTVSFSYVFLRSVDMAAAVSTGAAPLVDPVSAAGYLAPFHMLPAGPIGSYREHLLIEECGGRTLSFGEFTVHLNDVATGLFYKFVIAEALKIFAFGARGPLAAPTSLADTMFLLVYVFFDFAGYSRIALGIGRICGIPTPVNFRAPFSAENVTAFWTRWHMSLGAFVSRNIFTPLQLSLVRRFGVRAAHHVSLITLVLAFGFVGLWHRVSVRFILWGVAMGAIMFLEKVVRDRLLEQRRFQTQGASMLVRILGPAYVFVVISVSLRFVVREFLGV